MDKQSDGRRWGRLAKYGISAEENRQKVEAGFLWCCFCKQFLTSDKFAAFQIRKKFGARCKECDRARSRKWQLEHSERHKARMCAYYKENAEALREYQRKRRASWTPEHRRDDAFKRRLKYRYGISRERYQQILDLQSGKCAVCKRTQNGRRLAVDHDHSCCPTRKSCGKCLRGLLCERCNMLIGVFEKNKDLMAYCVAYLEKWGGF